MKSPVTSLPLAAVAILALGLGLVYGVETDRWKTSRELEAALNRLETFPVEFGDWKGTEIPFDREELTRAGIRGAQFRTYKNTRTGAIVSLLLVCGRGGPISVHTPDICYGGAGYQAVGVEERRTVPVGPDGGAAAFKVLEFSKPDAVVPTRLEIYWAWSVDGSFDAPSEARFAYARSPALYKMYVVREFAGTSRAAKENACEQFLRLALPEIQAALARTG